VNEENVKEIRTKIINIIITIIINLDKTDLLSPGDDIIRGMGYERKYKPSFFLHRSKIIATRVKRTRYVYERKGRKFGDREVCTQLSKIKRNNNKVLYYDFGGWKVKRIIVLAGGD